VKRIPLLLIATLLGVTPLAAEEPPGAEALLKAWGCRSCHRIAGYGGGLAADLSRVGQRLNPVDIRMKLHPLPGQNQGALMPTYPEMPDDEIRVISAYLAGLK